MKRIITYVFALSCLSVSGQNVTIPDSAFKNALVADTTINTNGDTEIQVSEATGFNGFINLYNLGISDLTGIEAFTAITGIMVSQNQLSSVDFSNNTALQTLLINSNLLTSLDLSQNTALVHLQCGGNALTSLDLSQNSLLQHLECWENNLTSLDVSNLTVLSYLTVNGNQLTALNVSSNSALTELRCGQNSITTVDISSNQNLWYLECSYMQPALTSLDVSNNPGLTQLWCNNNAITSLDLSANAALTKLSCSTNQLTSIDISGMPNLLECYCYQNQISAFTMGNNAQLTHFVVGTNQIQSLDLSGCPNLVWCMAGGNALTSFNIANGNNAGISIFDATVNPNLVCIKVDDAAWSNTNWQNFKDATATFDANCFVGIEADNGFMSSVDIYPNPAGNELTLTMKQAVPFSIYSMRGILVAEAPANLTQILDVSSLSSGIYVIRFANGSTSKFTKN